MPNVCKSNFHIYPFCQPRSSASAYEVSEEEEEQMAAWNTNLQGNWGIWHHLLVTIGEVVNTLPYEYVRIVGDMREVSWCRHMGCSEGCHSQQSNMLDNKEHERQLRVGCGVLQGRGLSLLCVCLATNVNMCPHICTPQPKSTCS